jgi:TfoX/Sxy family transcriptional regulator of competence genes
VAYDPETAERIRRHLADRDDVVEKRMVGGLSFMVGGRMCCGATSSGLMVRLGSDGAARALEEPHVRPLVFGGKPVAAFVVVDPEGYADDASLAAWLGRALAFLAQEG